MRDRRPRAMTPGKRPSNHAVKDRLPGSQTELEAEKTTQSPLGAGAQGPRAEVRVVTEARLLRHGGRAVAGRSPPTAARRRHSPGQRAPRAAMGPWLGAPSTSLWSRVAGPEGSCQAHCSFRFTLLARVLWSVGTVFVRSYPCLYPRHSTYYISVNSVTSSAKKITWLVPQLHPATRHRTNVSQRIQGSGRTKRKGDHAMQPDCRRGRDPHLQPWRDTTRLMQDTHERSSKRRPAHVASA